MITDLERELANIVHMGVMMRQAQREFFRTRDSGVLIEAKQRERVFDTMSSAALDTMRADGWRPS